MTVLDLALAHRARLQAIGQQTARRVATAWREISHRDISRSWRISLPAVAGAVAAGQLAAAAEADRYLTAVISQAGVEPDEVELIPEGFAGHAADGRDLNALLYLPAITTKQNIAAGRPVPDALQAGLRQALVMAQSEVTDAGRAADGAGMAARRTIQGYIRLATPPCCARCALLAGVEYGWSRGFARHPRCDCIHVPATLAARGQRGASRIVPATPRPGMVSDPHDYFRSLPPADQDRIFTQAGAAAIRAGADIGQVVNARRGMTTATERGRTVRATTEGTTRRSFYFRREWARLQATGAVPRGANPRGYRLRDPRLLPEEIYRVAADRDEAIALLRRYAYIV